MDGKQRWVSMQKSSVIFLMLMFSTLALATEEPLDMAFLEWLGETADVEALGVDIDKLLESRENSEQKPEEKSQ